jgi:hypothetical protein
MAQISIIPSLELTGLESSLSQVENLTLQLGPYREIAKTIDAKDASTYAVIGEALTSVRAIRKQGAGMFSPFDGVVDRVRSFLRTARQKHENACEEIEAIFLTKMKRYEFEERDKAEKEQAKLNKKLPEGEQVKVEPNLPSVSGYRKTVNWRVEVVDRSKYLNAFLKGDKTTRAFLGQFVTIDTAALGRYVRGAKDEVGTPEAFMKSLPGVKVSKE